MNFQWHCTNICIPYLNVWRLLNNHRGEVFTRPYYKSLSRFFSFSSIGIWICHPMNRHNRSILLHLNNVRYLVKPFCMKFIECANIYQNDNNMIYIYIYTRWLNYSPNYVSTIVAKRCVICLSPIVNIGINIVQFRFKNCIRVRKKICNEISVIISVYFGLNCLRWKFVVDHIMWHTEYSTSRLGSILPSTIFGILHFKYFL